MSTVKLKRSAVQGKIPTTSDLELGELAINTYDGKLYLKKDDGTASIVDVTSAAGISDIVQDLTPQLGGDLDTNGNDILFGDNVKAIFGAGSDLQIYHDGTHSYIHDNGTGNLNLRATDHRIENGSGNAYFIGSGGTVYLYKDGLQKLATTSTGVDVTGTITSDGLTVDGAASIGSSTAKTKFYSDSTYNGIYNGSSLISNESIYMGGGGAFFYTAASERMRIDSSGNVGIGTSSPQRQLHVSGSTGALRLQGTSVGGYIEIVGPSNTNYIGTPAAISSGSTTDLGFYVSSLERMRIDSSGRVGIGTDDPDALFTVKGQTVIGGTVAENANLTNLLSGTPPQLVAGWSVPAITWTPASYTEAVFTRDGDMAIDILTSNTANSRINFSDTDDEDVGWIDYDHANDSMSFRVNASERIRIDSSGNLLVGTTSADGGISGAAPRLAVIPPNTSSHGMVLKSEGATYDAGLIWNSATSGDNKFFEFGTETTYTVRGSISYNRAGGLVAYNTTSDYRAKDIAGPIEDASSTVLNLKPYIGTMKGATAERPMFVAHETQEVAPYAVTGEKDAVDQDGNPKYQQMDHSALVPLLTAALQEALKRIEALEAQLNP